MTDVWLNILQLIAENASYLLFLAVFVIGARQKAEWVTSIRSLATLLVIFTFCGMAMKGKIEAKDFMLVVSLIMNFYFLVKQRPSPGCNGNGDEAGRLGDGK